MKKQLYKVLFILSFLSSSVSAQIASTCDETTLIQACGIQYEDVSNTKDNTWLKFVAIDNLLFSFLEVFCNDPDIIQFSLYDDCDSEPIFTETTDQYVEFEYADLIVGQTYYIQWSNQEMTPCDFLFYVDNFGEPMGIDLGFNPTEYADGCSNELSDIEQFCSNNFIRFPVENFNVDNIGIIDFEVRDQDDVNIDFDWENDSGSGQDVDLARTTNPRFIDISFSEAGNYIVCLSSANVEGNCTMLYMDELCTDVTILGNGIRIEDNISLCYEDLLEGVIPDVEDNFGIPWQSGEIFFDDIIDGVVERSSDLDCNCGFTDILTIDILYPGQDGCNSQTINTCPQWNNGIQLSIDGVSSSINSVNNIIDDSDITIRVTEDILPDNSTIEWYVSNDINFVPGQSGQNIGSTSIQSNWNTCNQQAELLSILVESYSDPEEEVMVIGSGSGFYIDELMLDIENNCSENCPSDCEANPFGQGCDWATGNNNLLDGCNNTIAVAPGDYIPPNSTVILFLNNKSTQSLLAESLCSAEGCIYVLTNNCDRCLDAFTDNTSNSSYSIILSCGTSDISYGNNISNRPGAYVTKEQVYGEVERGDIPPAYIEEIILKATSTDFTYNVDCNAVSQGNIYIKGIINSPLYNSECCSPYTPTLSFNTTCEGSNSELNWIGNTSSFLPQDIVIMNGDCEEDYSFGDFFFSDNLPGIAYPYPLTESTHFESLCPLNIPVTFSSSHSPQDFYSEGTTTVSYRVSDGCNTLIHTFDVTIICDDEPVDDIFTDYPWLDDIVDPNDCDGVIIELYQFGASIFPYVIIDGIGILYSNTGLQYCREFSGFSCIDAYGLGSPIGTWTCDGCTCPDTIDPVCGADGITYNNACEAACAGVDVVATGECDDSEPNTIFLDYPWLNNIVDPNDCEGVIIELYAFGASVFPFVIIDGIGTLYSNDGTQYCQDFNNFSCIDAYGLGNPISTWTCEEPDDCNCPPSISPVCGVDGNTYGNECIAECAGVDVDYSGECVTNNDDQIFTDYPTLLTLVDPSDCEGTVISVYQVSGYFYYFIENTDGSILYSQNGDRYCQDFPGFSCQDTYGLNDNTFITQWTCENQTPCYTGTLTPTRPQNPTLDPYGPYFPDEIVNVSFLLSFTTDPQGIGNNCAWVQGVIPVLGSGWNLPDSNLEGNSNVTQGFDWYDDVDYNLTNNDIELSRNYYDEPILKYSPSNGNLQSGSILPGGWFYSSNGSDTGCTNDGHPDNSWGYPQSCGSTSTFNFNMTLVVDPCFDNNNCGNECLDMSIDMFIMSDGETGCYSNQACAYQAISLDLTKDCSTADINKNEIDKRSQSNNLVLIYPNPVEDILSIAYKAVSNDATISIKDVSGRTIEQITIQKETTSYQLDTKAYSSGLKLMEIRDGDQLIIKKFIKL